MSPRGRSRADAARLKDERVAAELENASFEFQLRAIADAPPTGGDRPAFGASRCSQALAMYDVAMSSMTDPHDALVAFQEALNDGVIATQPAERHPGVLVHFDTPLGTPRYTFAEVEHDVVNAVALLALTEPLDGVACFQLGYAVRADCRGQGKGHAIVAAAIDEVTVGLGRNGGRELAIEAVVGRENGASRAIALRALGDQITDCIDHQTGEPAVQYARVFKLPPTAS